MTKSNILALTVAALLSTTIGCGGKSSPTAPSPVRNAQSTDCAAGCDGVLRAPSQWEADAALTTARDAVRRWVDSGQLQAKRKIDWNAVPQIDYKACPFWAEDGYYYDAAGNRITGTCAAGYTDYYGGRIVIATNDIGRTIPLIKWETVNYYLSAIGRTDLCDRWSSTYSL